MSARFLDSKETRQMFQNDEIFQEILKGEKVDPKCIEIIYAGASSAAFTEIGTAMTAEFKGDAFEKTTVLCSTRVLTPGGSYFHIYVINSSAVITQYYIWFSKYEVFTVTCLAAAAITTSTYFLYSDSEGAPTSYYVWMDKNGDGVTDDPSPAGGATGVPCDISGATTAGDVATIVAAAINGLAGTGAGAVADLVTVTMATKGDPTDAVDVDTTFTIAVTENGGADPGASGTGAECDIKAATTAANVATIVQGIIDALADVTATVSTATVTITNDETGLVTAVTDFDTLFTITQVEQSASEQGGAPLYLVSAHADDTDNIAKDMRKNTILGFAKDADGKPDLYSEEVFLAGATPVKTAILKWIRAIHHGGSDWGTAGQDAKGNISLQNVDATAFLVLTAALNESEGGVIWVPNHIHCLIAEMSLKFNDLTLTTAGDGVMVRFVKSGLDETKNNRLYNLDPDNPYVNIVISRETPSKVIKWPTKAVLHGSDVGKLTLQEGQINTSHSFLFTAYVIMWYKSNS